MKFSTIIDQNIEQEVIIHAHEKTSLVNQIELLCINDGNNLIGTHNGESFNLNPLDITLFQSNNNNVVAYIGTKEYRVKAKLYQLEELYPDLFIKINQSCLANKKRIKKFSTTIGGALMVTFDNNINDYISRRELKNVKERMGL